MQPISCNYTTTGITRVSLVLDVLANLAGKSFLRDPQNGSGGGTKWEVGLDQCKLILVLTIIQFRPIFPGYNSFLVGSKLSEIAPCYAIATDKV